MTSTLKTKITKLIIGAPIPPMNKPTDLFKIFVFFEDGDEVSFLEKDYNRVILYLNFYQLYLDLLNEDWNTWCNPEDDELNNVALEIFDEIYEDFIYDHWSKSNKYDRYALCTGYGVTYFDQNGVENQVDIIKN